MNKPISNATISATITEDGKEYAIGNDRVMRHMRCFISCLEDCKHYDSIVETIPIYQPLLSRMHTAHLGDPQSQLKFTGRKVGWYILISMSITSC